MRGGGTLVVKAEDLTIKSIERSEVEERVRVENEVIHFDDYDEYATYTLTLENPTSTKLQVTNINLTNNECVSINTDELASTIVEPNSTKEVTLTLTSNKCNVNQDNTALLSFKSKEYKEDKIEEKEDIVSPNTYGNISVFLVVLFILTAIYISLYIYSKKKPFKYLKLSTIIYLSLLVITTITYTIMTSFSANEESLSLTFSYTYKPRRVLMKREYDDCGFDETCFDEEEGTLWESSWEIKNIYIQNTIERPSSFEKVYDASMNQDESILVYKVINPNDSDYYDLYIMANGQIYGNINSAIAFAFGSLEKIEGLNNFDTFGVEDMSRMFLFYNCNSNTKEILDLSHFDTSKVTNMYGMLSMVCADIKGIENFDTTHVTNMGGMFFDYKSVIPLNLSNFDTSNVTDMSSMFEGYSSSAPLDLSHLDTSNVTNMSYMFCSFGNEDVELTIDVSNFNTSKVTDMSYMFAFNSNAIVNIRGLNNLDTSKVTNMRNMLSNYNSSTPLDLSFLTINEGTDISGLLANYGSSSSLDLSKLDISKVTSLQSLFSYYKSNQALDLTPLDTSNVTNMSYMFSSYSSSAPLDLSHLDTSNVTNMSEMFSVYSSSAALDISNLDTSNVTNMSYMFSNWNSTADLDMSNITFTTLPQNMFLWKQKANKIYVANNTIKNLLKNSGWNYMTDENIIVKGE